jgi:hypothetical protein
LWKYNGTDDSTHAIKKGYANRRAIGAALAAIYKGEGDDLVKEPMFHGFASYQPVEAVSCLSKVLFFEQSFYLRDQLYNISEQNWRRWVPRLLNRSFT